MFNQAKKQYNMDFLSLLPSLFQGGAGLAQLFGGLFGQKEQPKAVIPQAAKDALNIAKHQANTEMPGKALLETQIGERTAQLTNNIGKMGGGAAGLGALANIYGQELNARRNLTSQAAQYKNQMTNQLIGAEGAMAGQENRVNDYNVNQGIRNQQATSALIQGGMHNVFSGLNNVAGANAYDKLYKLLGLGDNGVTKTTPSIDPDSTPDINNDPEGFMKMYNKLFGTGHANFTGY